MDFNGTFFVTIISFLVFVFVMNKILYEPVRKIVHKRNDYINENYLSADKNNQEADQLELERNEKIVEAKSDAKLRYNEILGGYKDQKSEIIKTAQEESNNTLNQAYTDLENISNEAKEGLKWKMTDLANDIVEKVLGYRSEIREFDNDKVNQIFYH